MGVEVRVLSRARQGLCRGLGVFFGGGSGLDQWLPWLRAFQAAKYRPMLLGKVIGTIWATRKDEQLNGMKLQIVQRIGLDGASQGSFVVAVDSVGAGAGETVLVAQGSVHVRQPLQK